jgi:hypothetical protein
VNSVTKNADLHVGTGNSGELESTTETLVLCGIIVLKTELELDGLKELALLALQFRTVDGDLVTRRVIEDVLNGGDKDFRVDFTGREKERGKETEGEERTV